MKILSDNNGPKYNNSVTKDKGRTVARVSNNRENIHINDAHNKIHNRNDSGSSHITEQPHLGTSNSYTNTEGKW